jgi:hypothetical protein
MAVQRGPLPQRKNRTMRTRTFGLHRGSIKAVWLALAALGAGVLTAVALRGPAGAEGIPATEPLYYSGELLENGAPVDDARPVVLTLWSHASATDGASKKCETSAPSAAIVKGSFRVALAAACAAQIRSTPDLWIEPVVGGKSLGRRKIGAAPYAVEADHAASASRASEAIGALNERITALEQKLAAVSQGLGPLLQTGSLYAGMNTPAWTLLTGTGERFFRLPVKFPQPFARPPVVVVNLAQFDIINAFNARLDVRAEQVSAEGFTAVFHTWADAQVYSATLTWTALQK